MTGVLVALDVPRLEDADVLARDLVDIVDGFKVGMELLMASGPAAIEAIAGLGKPVFADAKLHDIPTTVGRAAARISSAGARWVTVHAAGGRKMIESANRGMGGKGVLVVTVLTSLSSDDLSDIGVVAAFDERVAALANLGREAGAEGAVCSPAEITTVREQVPGLKVFTPGVRSRGDSADDQRRVSTPEEAAADGADYLVIGRSITRAAAPADRAREIMSNIAGITRT